MACGSGWTAAQFSTEVSVSSLQVVVDRWRGGGVNEGENKVFPIQVSRQELLLFLSAVIVIDTYKNTFYMNTQTVNCVTFYLFFGKCYRQTQIGVIPTQRRKLKGKRTSPSRSIVQNVIFIAVSIIFIFSTAYTNALLVPVLIKSF